MQAQKEVLKLQVNPAKHKLEAGHAVLVPSFGANSIPDNDTLDQLGTLGVVDVAWVEMESGPFTWRDLGDIARVCELRGITSLARVNSNDPALIGRTLDLGIQSVMVPHVSTREDAEQVVQAALYAPKGLRNAGHSRQAFGVPDYYQKANDEVMIVAMLESLEAIDNLDDILKVENIDCFYVAPVDLGQTMGAEYLGKAFHPDVQKVVHSAIRKIVASGHRAGTAVNNNNVEDFLKLGVRFLRFSAFAFLQEGLQRFQEKVLAAAE